MRGFKTFKSELKCYVVKSSQAPKNARLSGHDKIARTYEAVWKFEAQRTCKILKACEATRICKVVKTFKAARKCKDIQ